MNKSDRIHMLYDRMKNKEALEPLFEDYKVLVSSFSAEDAAYRSALRPLMEEFPDLDRLQKRKFDAVLLGRISDALGVLKLKVAELEGGAVENGGELPPVEGRIRNIPNLGMD